MLLKVFLFLVGFQIYYMEPLLWAQVCAKQEY